MTLLKLTLRRSQKQNFLPQIVANILIIIREYDILFIHKSKGLLPSRNSTKHMLSYSWLWVISNSKDWHGIAHYAPYSFTTWTKEDAQLSIVGINEQCFLKYYCKARTYKGVGKTWKSLIGPDHLYSPYQEQWTYTLPYLGIVIENLSSWIIHKNLNLRFIWEASW